MYIAKMVNLPYISCNGTCFVHEIFRLDAIERYIRVFRFCGIFSNSAISLRIRARGKNISVILC